MGVWLYYVLFFLVGISSWLLINGLFLQIPIFVRVLPEQFVIASYLVISTQVGNVFGLLHFVVRACPSSCWEDGDEETRRKKRRKGCGVGFLKGSVLLILSLAMVVTVLTAYLWNDTIMIAGRETSIYLVIFCVLQGGIGSLSVVVFFPFAASYGTKFTAAMSTGMGFSGLAASIVSLIQAPQANPPTFGVAEYFLILLAFICLSLISAVLLLVFPPVKLDSNDDQYLVRSQHDEDSFSSMFGYLHVQVFNQIYISLMSYLILGILPYLVVGLTKDTQDLILFWNSLFAVVFGTLGRALAGFYFNYSLKILTISMVILWVYLVSMCFVQQRATLPDFVGWLSVICNSLFVFLYGYTDTLNYQKVAFIFSSKPHLIEKGTAFIGVGNQIGAVIGSVIAFLLALLVFRGQ